MSTQQDAADIYQQAQDAAAEAWGRAATNQTAYMHRFDPAADELAEQARANAAWMRAHPGAVQSWRRFRAAALAVGGLCLLGVELGVLLFSAYRYGLTHDGRWMGLAVLSFVVLYLLAKAVRK